MKFRLPLPQTLGIMALSIAVTLSAAHAQTVLLDVGPTATMTAGWNSMISQNTSVSLLDITGASTGISVSNSGFSNVGTTGPASMTGDALAAFGASTDVAFDFFATTATTQAGAATLTFSGLDLTKTYTLTLFGSRAGVSDNRTGDYVLVGSSSTTLTLNATANTANIIVFQAASPTAGGVLTLNIFRDAANTGGFAYVNAVKLEVAPIPEPSTVAMLTLGGIATLFFIVRRRRAASV